jgi:purine-binding chemotaxis protein CheW
MKPPQSHDDIWEILAFLIAEQRHGVLLQDVVEVQRAVAVTRLLKMPEAVEGIINFRGSVVPVLDLRRRFGLPGKPVEPSDHMIVVRTGRRQAVLRVDEVAGVLSVEPQAFDRSRSAAPRDGLLTGTLKLADGLTLIYALDTFLSPRDEELFDIAVAEGADQ